MMKAIKTDGILALIEIDRSVAKMAENKTCPFCGSDSIEVYTHYGESAGIQYGGYYPECTVCGCRLNYYDSREEALKAWNERADDGREND
jgi:Lar family restriction alleviation protein